MNNPLKPSTTLLIKLGSALIHAEEMVESKFKHLDFDLEAFKTVAEDLEVKAWIAAMNKMAFLPKKR